ncbi:cytochrome c oxidase subunit 3 [Peijinzhouia sedimentorum]
MTSDYKLTEEALPTYSMNPKKFILWLFIVSIVMIFAALTSAYIVRQAEGNWLQFEMPTMLYISSVVILLSSATLHWSYLAAKKDKLANLKIGIIITTILGFIFLATQFEAWKELVAMDVYFVGNPAGSFLYVLTGLHAFHLIFGVIFLIIVLISSFRDKVHSKNLNLMEMGATFWHFLGGLWIYLFLFLLLNH